MRNSSLVEWCCADNVTGLKPVTEAMVLPAREGGRGAFLWQRSPSVRKDGAKGSETAGMSSARHVRNMPTESLRFPTQG